jgi:hypothetical protein
VRAFDERKDLAVIQIPGFGLPALSLGDSESVPPGTRVLVIGNALGILEGSLSTGVISGFRNMDGYKVLQTDASANHGNSGGPMLDENANVVGVVTFKIGEGVAENLNFAVPINYARGMLSTSETFTLADLSTRLGKTTDLFASASVASPKRWKSLTSGTVKIIRTDADYLYSETESSDQARRQGDFQLAQLKKVGDRYIGTIKTTFTCSYTRGVGIYATARTNRCSFEEPVEINLFSPTRIEGRAPEAAADSKFKCWECKYDPPRSKWGMRPFTWIPE